MKARSIPIFLALAICAPAIGQESIDVGGQVYRLSPPKAIAVGVRETVWEPKGTALLYDAKDLEGRYHGIYDLKSEKGRSVVRIPAGVEIPQIHWLAKKPIVLEIWRHPAQEGQPVRWSVMALDGATFTAKELWSREVPAGQEVHFDVDVSPTRAHALVTITTGQSVDPWVLTEDASGLVFSRDLAQAVKDGAEFAGWSLDGTAYYVLPEDSPTTKDLPVALTGFLKQAEEITYSVELKIGDLLRFKMRRTAPVGSTVFEVMPHNGVLRLVPSKGNYSENFTAPPVAAFDDQAQVNSMAKRGISHALWLTTGKEDTLERIPAALISADADRFWQPDYLNAVAFTRAGALFIRTISKD